MTQPRISFGIIVLNGEPFTRYCLRSLYPYAHEILVVEGGSHHAAHACTPDGHSLDSTRETVRRFMAEEDPQQKVQLITRNGFWNEKDEQSAAYATRATGDWLWQVDIDEFYTPKGMETVLQLLQDRPESSGAAFNTRNFWGSLAVEVDGLYLQAMCKVFRRLFRWGPGYRYAAHRPPTVLDEKGRDLYTKNWVDSEAMEELGVQLFHYSLLFPRHVAAKSHYYESLSAGARRDATWYRDAYLQLGRPFHVYNVYRHLSWLQRYTGTHPPAVYEMMADIASGALHEPLRPMDDANLLLQSENYRRTVSLLRLTLPYYRLALHAWHRKPSWLSKRGLRQILGMRG